MVKAIDSRASAPGSSYDRVDCVVLLGNFSLRVPLSTQVYHKWVPANLLPGSTLHNLQIIYSHQQNYKKKSN